MLRLNQYIIFLVVWLGFFFNVERLHIHKVELVDIAGPIYALAIIVVLIGLILPQYRLISHRSLELFVIVLFGLAKLLDPNPFWGDRYTYVTLFEVGAILVTAFLAHEVGRQTADFMRTVRMILFADQQERVLTPEQAAPILQREMKAARRTNKPLTVLVVEAKPGDHQMHLNATANEIHQLLVKRYRLVALTRLLTQFIRSTDFVLDWSERG
ncbi:MAG TPA: hypothetical protein VFD70_02305, partial [Anaerolineae bacterium]|nr:hypothetical protein [Anaerolineae bacterium]